MNSLKQDSLGRLHDLAVFLSSEADLNKRLQDLARHVAQATQAAACTIALLAEDEVGPPRLKLFASTETPSASPADEALGSSDGLVAHVLEQGKPLLIADVSQSAFAPLMRKRAGLGCSFIGMPITVANCTIGVMNLSNRAGTPAFDESDLTMAGIVAVLIGKTIQVERLQTLLRSRIAQQSLLGERREVTDRLIAGTLPPSRLAKMLAKSFYKDLAGAGFASGQIIEAASEIITWITSDVGRFQKRLARKNK